MGKIIRGVLLIILVAMLSGCQSTPEDSVVVGKDAAAFEEKLKEKASVSGGETQTYGDTADASLKFTSEKLKDEFLLNDGHLSIKVDAEVSSIIGSTPVYRVVPDMFTSENVKAWADVLFQGNTAYDAKKIMTKTEISQKILKLQKELDSDELYGEFGSDPTIWEKVKADYEQRITYYKSIYEDAPEEAEISVTDWKFHPWSYYYGDGDADALQDKTMETQGYADIGGVEYTLNCAVRNQADYMINNLAFYHYGQKETIDKEPVQVSEEEAKALVQEILDDLGLVDWKIDTVGRANICSDDNAKIVVCRRYYNGIPCAVLPQLTTVKGENDYAAKYYYEDLEFNVVYGEIDSIWYYSPMKIKTVEAENADVLDLDGALGRFKEHISLMYADIEQATSVRIRRIEQSLVRIKVPNAEGEFYLVPSWSFYGHVAGEAAESEGGDYLLSPILCINGIDGSVINTVLGY